jgi:hypothetical protein
MDLAQRSVKSLKIVKLPIRSRLQVLQAASRFAPGARRVVAAADGGNSLAAVLREVNETILGRSLQFEADEKTSLTMDVAGRRILRLTGASGVKGAETCLGVKVLSAANLDDLAGLLVVFAGGKTEMSVVAKPLERGGEGMSVGLPVALLADVLGVDLNQTAEDDRGKAEAAPPPTARLGFLATIVAEMGEGLLAWLVQSGTSDLQSGGLDEMVQHLNGFLDDEYEALGAQLDQVALSPDDPVCTVLGTSLLEGHSILCVRAEGELLLGVVAGDAAGTVLRAWNAARR